MPKQPAIGAKIDAKLVLFERSFKEQKFANDSQFVAKLMASISIF